MRRWADVFRLCTNCGYGKFYGGEPLIRLTLFNIRRWSGHHASHWAVPLASRDYHPATRFGPSIVRQKGNTVTPDGAGSCFRITSSALARGRRGRTTSNRRFRQLIHSRSEWLGLGVSQMAGMGRKADGRLSGPHSEKPAIECACQIHRIFASADTQLSCRSLADAKSVVFASCCEEFALRLLSPLYRKAG